MQHNLALLVLLNGFMSNANVPGVEKLTMTTVQHSWLQAPATKYRLHEDLGMDSSVHLVAPQTVFAVKGWNRCMALMGVCYCGFTTPALIEARPCCCGSPSSTNALGWEALKIAI